MKKQVHLLISGVVQGVFFRASTSHAARALGLTGFVRNRSDGDVEVVAEGEEGSLEKMIGWCRKGPSGARVESVDVKWSEATDQYRDFRIS